MSRSTTDRLRGLPWAAVLAGVVIALLSWGVQDARPMAGIDPSWEAALHMAAHSDLHWGRDLVFTYGPLGFLRIPTYWYTDTGALAVAFLAATRLALAAVLWQIARRPFGRVGAVVILAVVCWTVHEALPAIAFGLAVCLVAAPLSARASLGIAVALGALAGVTLLIKLNSGATVLAVGVVGVLAAPGPWRATAWRAATWAAAALGVLLVVWLSLGQSLGDLWLYGVRGVEIVSGYSQVMMTESAGTWQYAAALGIALAVAVLTWTFTLTADVRGRIGLILIWAIWAFLSFKGAFVRHDDAHAPFYFAAAAVGIAALPWRRGALAPAAGVTALAAAVVVFTVASGASAGDVIAPRAHVAAAVRSLRTLWDGDRRERLQELGRKDVLRVDKLDPPTLSAIRGRTVAVAPTETAAAWAYRRQLRWDPVPVLQDYQAYTAELDRIDAAKLLAPDAPERILFQPGGSVDRRLGDLDVPSTTLARLCRYRPIRAQRHSWLVMARRPNACGRPRPVASVRADWGQTVAVPPPSASDAIVFVRVSGAGVHGAERLRAFFFRAHERRALFDGAWFRVPPGVVGNGLPLWAGHDADFPFPLNLVRNTSTFGLDRDDHPRGGTPLRFDFYEVRNGGMPRVPSLDSRM